MNWVIGAFLITIVIDRIATYAYLNTFKDLKREKSWLARVLMKKLGLKKGIIVHTLIAVLFVPVLQACLIVYPLWTTFVVGGYLGYIIRMGEDVYCSLRRKTE